jgi:hypothetical protein
MGENARMTKRIHKVITTDAEIDAAIDLAGRYPIEDAVGAMYIEAEDLIAIHFSDGVELRIPRRLVQGLERATPGQLGQIQIEGPGTGLVWPALGVAHYIPGLAAGIFGTRRWMAEMGRRGGMQRTKAKAAAARANGAKGGRPRGAGVRGKSVSIRRRPA